MKVILIKLGGGLITDKKRDETLRNDVLARLAKEIHEARVELAKEGKMNIVVGHGGGSFPHRPAKEYSTSKGMINEKSVEGISRVQDAASRLNRIVVGALIKAGEPAISFAPSAWLVTRDKKPSLIFKEPIEKSLELGMLMVPFGDVVFDEKMGCTIASTETVLDALGKTLDVGRIIIASNEEGVWKDYPKNTEIIEEITSENFEEVKSCLGGSNAVDVTGGMLGKVITALEISKNTKCEVLIMSGLVPGRLKDAILGKKVPGTIVRA